MKNEQPNEHIRRYLKEYCKLKPPGFAVLLTGPWGCGKTSFIHSHIQNESTDEENSVIYVSLFGMTSPSQINDAIFEQVHPVLASKGMRLAGRILSGTLKAALRVDLREISGAHLPEELGFLKNLHDRTLVFDDLERCEMPIRETLGYINALVEHEGHHVIVLADETRISKADQYRKVKEKLIGQAFEVQPDVRAAIAAFCKELPEGMAREFVLENQDVLIRSLEMSGYRNLRAIRMAMIDFVRIFDALDDQFKDPNKFRELLRFLLMETSIVTLERCHGELKLDDFRLMFSPVEHIFALQEEDEADPLARIVRKYVETGIGLTEEPVPDAAQWEQFIRTGFFDPAKLNEAVRNSRFVADQNRPNWVKLWHWRDLADDEFNKILGEVDEEIKREVHRNTAVIKHIYAMFLWFSERGLYQKSDKTITERFQRYVQRLAEQGELKWQEDDESGYAGLGYYPVGERFGEFSRFVRERFEKQQMARLPDQANELLGDLKRDPSEFYRKLISDGGEEGEFARLPILAHLNPDYFVEALSGLHNIWLSRIILSIFKERYSKDWINRFLLPELEWLEKVKEKISEKAQEKAGVVSGQLLRDIEELIDRAIETLRKAKEVNGNR